MMRLFRRKTEEIGPLKVSIERPSGIQALKLMISKERLEIKRRFLFLMLYLYSLTTFNVDTKAAYRFIGSLDVVLGPISKYFRKMDILVNKWGYKQDRACIITAKLSPSLSFRRFLLRLAYNLNIGASFAEFVKVEYNKFMTDFDFYFQRTMDKLRIIADVYTALLDTAVIVSMTIVLASILFGAINTYNIMILILTIILSSIFTALSLIKINIPIDIEHSHKLPRRPRKIRLLDSLSKKVLIAVSISSFLPAILAYTYLDNNQFIENTIIYSGTIALIFIIPGAAAYILGYLGLQHISHIEKLDEIYPVFINTLGEAASLAGSLKEGLRRILYNDYGSLTSYIRRLYYRLHMGIDRMTAWNLFGQETSSNLIYYLTMIFIYSVNQGAMVRKTALYIYDTSMRYRKRRQGRGQIANYFKGMALPLQATFIAVLTLIVVLIGMFGKFASLISKFIATIELPDLRLLLTFIYLLMAILAIGNAWAIYLLKGDSIYTFLFYLGIGLVMSGAIFFVMAAGSAELLSSFIRFQRGVQGVFGP